MISFLPIVLLAYFLAGRVSYRLRLIVLMGASLVFYWPAGIHCCLLLLGSLLVNYGLCQLLRRRKAPKAIVTVGILLNVLLLFLFKYYNFFAENVQAFLGAELPRHSWLLPLGISFYTFQQISYLLERYRGQGEEDSFLEYGAYILYFPKLVMGPLTEPGDLIRQFRDPQRKHLNWDNLMGGICIFVRGLLKKVFFADIFAAAVNWGFSHVPQLTAVDTGIVMVCYTLQIYFDFSGYSDMAVGISKMLNLQLPQNFHQPYRALSVGDFWKRWHMTLTGFFTRNIYIPLGGSRRGQLRTYCNVMIVFLVSGIWHGANWTFLLWGLLYGLLVAADKALGKHNRLPAAFNWMITFAIVNVLWLLFRADSVGQWIYLLRNMLSLRGLSVTPDLLRCMFAQGLEILEILVPVLSSKIHFLLFVLAGLLVSLFCREPQTRVYRPGILQLAGSLSAALLCFWLIYSNTMQSTFVYFGF